MKTKRILSVALLAIGTAIFTTACFKSKKMDSGSGSNYTVSMNNSAFSPASLTVVAGSTVTWMNDDNVIHAVTTADNSIHTGDIAPASSSSVTFNTIGTYNYYDAHNTNMTGQLIVTGSGSSGGN
jgi:plastocyanin